MDADVRSEVRNDWCQTKGNLLIRKALFAHVVSYCAQESVYAGKAPTLFILFSCSGQL